MLLTVVVAVLVGLGVSQVASAQARYDFKFTGAFVANGKAFPAGGYGMSVNTADDLVTLTPTDGKGESVAMAVQTRIAERKPPTRPEVVFDKLGGQLYLSDLLLPGQDGYVPLATKAKHTHESMAGTPPRGSALGCHQVYGREGTVGSSMATRLDAPTPNTVAIRRVLVGPRIARSTVGDWASQIQKRSLV
jgi:hypothetical protein